MVINVVAYLPNDSDVEEMVELDFQSGVDMGIRSSYKMDLSDALRLGFQNADTVILGDTSHSDYRAIWGALGDSKTQVAIAESGVRDMFLELPHYRQGLVNEFQRNAVDGSVTLDSQDFSERFQHDDDFVNNVARWDFALPSQTQDYMQNYVSPVIATASRLGIDVHTLDQDNGRNEKVLRNEARRAALDVREDIQKIQANQDVTDPVVKANLETLKEQFQIFKKDFQYYRDAFHIARHDDRNLAQVINENGEDSKNLVMFGAAHGSRPQDFEEFINGSSLKIDIAVSRASYETINSQAYARMQNADETFGTDRADLVYFIDEGVLATTVNTPPEIAAQIAAQAPLVSETQSPAQDETSPTQGIGIKN